MANLIKAFFLVEVGVVDFSPLSQENTISVMLHRNQLANILKIKECKDMTREENIKRIELSFSTWGLSMARKIYYACKAIGVKAYGEYSGPGKHICEFSVS